MTRLVLDLSDVTVVIYDPDGDDDGPACLLITTEEAEVRLVPGDDWGEALPALWVLVDRAVAFSALLEGRGRHRA